MSKLASENLNNQLQRNRSPIQNDHASRYLLLMLLSFAFSVSATRLFLYLTGYPKIGSGNVHIAHVLFGGLILFIACILPLVLANEWAHTLSAVLCGLGIGLFIDEVGKFITANNDYFSPSAAPIIYAFFLLSVLLFTQVRSRHHPSPRGEMYTVLNDLNEVLDKDLSFEERDALLLRLQPLVKQTSEPELGRLAMTLTDFLSSGETQVVEHVPSFLERIQLAWFHFESTWLNRSNLRKVILVLLAVWAAWALFYPIGYYLSSNNPGNLQAFIQAYLSDRLERNASGFNWVEARVYLEGSMGLLAAVAGGLILAGRDRSGMMIAYIDMLLTLTVVDLIIFYFDQFSTIFFAIGQFVLLMLIIRYRARFLQQAPPPSPDPGSSAA
jgi:hypothetical protein